VLTTSINGCATQTSSPALQQPAGEGDKPVPQGTDTLAVNWNTVRTGLLITYIAATTGPMKYCNFAFELAPHAEFCKLQTIGKIH